MIEKESLRKYARNLMFEMKEEEYDVLLKEFDVVLKKITLIDNIPEIKDVSPMTFPYVNYDRDFREDIEGDSLTVDDVLLNVKHSYLEQVKVPKVVE